MNPMTSERRCVPICDGPIVVFAGDNSMYEQSKCDGIYQTVNRQTAEPIYYPAPGMGERSSSGDILGRSAGGRMFAATGYDVPQPHRTYEMPYLNKRCLQAKTDQGQAMMQTCLQSGTQSDSVKRTRAEPIRADPTRNEPALSRPRAIPISFRFRFPSLAENNRAFIAIHER